MNTGFDIWPGQEVVPIYFHQNPVHSGKIGLVN